MSPSKSEFSLDFLESSKRDGRDEGAGRDRAVLCGINDYESISPLRGCVNDVGNLRALLIDVHGFDERHIRVLTDSQVTKDAVEQGFAWLYEGARAGDRLIFHFSGHGSYTLSEDDDEKVDELLCLHDMDFDDERTYLIDDDLGRLTRQAPKGVHLTIILDCCHSGTGTRAIRRRTVRVASKSTSRSRQVLLAESANSLKLSGARSVETEIEEGNVTADKLALARFVEPPFRLTRSQRTRHLGTRSQIKLNHQLLAGAAAEQTAADAWIADDHHGAFTYNLCRSARELGNGATVEDVFRRTERYLEDGGFSQRPQNEGPFSDARIFGAGEGTPNAEGSTVDFVPPSVEPAPPPAPADEDTSHSDLESSATPSAERLDRFFAITERLLGMERAAGRTSGTAGLGDTRSGSEQHLVCVHGIGRHRRGYSDRWFRQVSRYSRRPLVHGEVLWSHHVNEGLRSLGTSSRQTRQARDFAAELEREVRARAQRIEERVDADRQETRSMSVPRGSALEIDDFSRYMTHDETRRAVLQEFDDVVRPLLMQGATINLLTHSWGTVVSYEGLRRMDEASYPGRVAHHFVVGSALSIGVVQANLFGRVSGGRRPAHVDRMINVNAKGDLVGGSIDDEFDVDREFSGLPPYGCRTIPFVGAAWNPACAHGSYFTDGNAEVQRDIFARFIG